MDQLSTLIVAGLAALGSGGMLLYIYFSMRKVVRKQEADSFLPDRPL
jgi:hypothetical protein